MRALTPGIGAFLELEGGERLGVEAARAVDEPLEPGEVRVVDGRLLVGCAEGALELDTVKPAGRARRCRPPTTCAATLHPHESRRNARWPRRPAAAPTR